MKPTSITGTGSPASPTDLSEFSRQRRRVSVDRHLSCVRHDSSSREFDFSTSSDGQELYCQLDAGPLPIKFVFGNVAYADRPWRRDQWATRRALAVERLNSSAMFFIHTRHSGRSSGWWDVANAVGANSVVGIQTTIMPFRGIHEMMMTGTASRHPELPREFDANPATSDFTCEEMWNMVSMGSFADTSSVLGTAVYILPGHRSGASRRFRKSFSGAGK